VFPGAALQLCPAADFRAHATLDTMAALLSSTRSVAQPIYNGGGEKGLRQPVAIATLSLSLLAMCRLICS
jgi:hypothetical protein